MFPEKHTRISTWTEEDLVELPPGETDEYEFKSSLIRESAYYRGELSTKLTKTASALWNTGGGVLVVGVDDNGVVDGGIPAKMGKQKLREWVDMIVNSVSPVGPYTVRTIKHDPNYAQSKIDPAMVVLVVAFGESFDLPHQAPDNRYYVRAGAHSNPASHYLIEAIRARRGLERPLLRALLRENPQKSGVVELTIVSVNDRPAMNVSIDFDPLPTHLAEQMPDRLPLVVPLIDRNNPFRMDIATIHRLQYWLGDTPFHLLLQYEGVRGTQFNDTQLIDHLRSLGPSEIRLSNGNSQANTLKKIHKQLRRLSSAFEQMAQNGNLAMTDTDDEAILDNNNPLE
ncbi:MAG: RNA-binding domain-containing protein [Chloroflexota bacterium]